MSSASDTISVSSNFFHIDHQKKVIIINKPAAAINQQFVNVKSHILLDNVYEFHTSVQIIEKGVEYNVSKNSEMYKLYFSELPVIKINTNYTIVDDPRVYALFKLYENNGNYLQSNIGVEYRGEFSQTLPKKSLSLRFWNDTLGNEKRDVSLIGLREDNKYNLQAMYNEPLRIRSEVSNELWRQIHQPYYLNEESGAINGIRAKYVDLFINNEYRGVYALSEPVDRKQLKLKKHNGNIRGELYKADYWFSPVLFDSVPTFINGSTYWGGFEHQYPDEIEPYWNNFHSFVNFVVSANDCDFYSQYQSKFQVENAVDYFIFINLLRATDNRGKNLFIAKYAQNHPYFFVPWDLDGVLGNIYDGTRDLTTIDILSNGFFDRIRQDCSSNGFNQKLVNRWNNLRNGGLITTSNIISMLNNKYAFLKANGVYDREKIAWNGFNEDTTEIQYITNWLNARINYLDTAFALPCNPQNIHDIPPTAIAKDLTVYLNNNGTANINAAQIDNGSSDACGIANMIVTPNAFNCSHLGTRNVVLRVTDISAIQSFDTAIVAIVDTIKPIAITQNRTVYLNSNGEAVLTADQVNNGSFDNCGLNNFTLSKSVFNCNDLGVNIVQFTALDNSGNQRSVYAEITVIDTIKPIGNAQNLNVYLNNQGLAQIYASMVNNSIQDNCSISNFELSKTSFDCNDLGLQNLILTATDESGNQKDFSFSVMVIDTITPAIGIVNNISITSQPNICGAVVNWTTPSIVDNCQFNVVSNHHSGDLFTAGNTTVTYNVSDNSGNASTKSFNVYVFDNQSPIFINGPQNLTVSTSLNSNMAAVSWNLPTVDDNCTFTLTSNYQPGTSFPIGTTTVIYTAVDGNNNSSQYSFNVTVIDQESPVFSNIHPDITTCEGLAVYYTLPSATDNSNGPVSVSRIGGYESGFVFPPGLTFVKFKAIDDFGNFELDSFAVMVHPKQTAPQLIPNGSLDLCELDTLIISTNFSGPVYWSNNTFSDEISINLSTNISAFFIDNNGCESHVSEALIITKHPIPPTPIISANNNLTVCEGENINLSANLNESIIWSNGQTGSSISIDHSGSYYAYYNDAFGCRSHNSTALNITINPLPTSPIIDNFQPIYNACFGDTILVNAAGNNIHWSNGAIGNNVFVTETNSIYAYSVDLNTNCKSINSNVFTALFYDKPSVANLSFSNGKIKSDLIGNYQYVWYLNGSLLSNLNAYEIPFQGEGSYSLELKNQFNCSSVSNPFYFSVLGLNDNYSAFGINIYPNPFNSSFRITGKMSNKMKVTIFDNIGNIVWFANGNDIYNLDIGFDFATGLYFIIVEDENQKRESFKIIKTQ